MASLVAETPNPLRMKQLATQLAGLQTSLEHERHGRREVRARGRAGPATSGKAQRSRQGQSWRGA